MASIDGNGSTKATATTLYFLRIPILAPRYICLEKRGIFLVTTVEDKFGKLWRHINYRSKNNSPNEWAVPLSIALNIQCLFVRQLRIVN
ncbi:hypothetical protein [Microcoleus sp. LEGE 07076]|uniref:hypothetical protein n=1 Tax=Microcoleus sp. LEGE 07076 TaxID=915322 RepID=UPI00187FC993|nr:hypothetical protein [Microcoleus sp. LEGE 07076]